jgi:hypothetical protein
VESTIFINSTLREARAGTTGAGLPEVTLTLLAQWLCHVRFFASGEDPALLDTPAFVLSIKETPTGTALVRTETSAENDDGDGYDFEFESIDGESLRALLGDEPSLDLVLEIEWTVDSVTERVHMPCTVINAYNRPDDTAPDPAEAETDAWLTARAVRHDSAQTLTTDQKTQARSNIGAAASTHTHTIADVSGLQTALDGKSSSGHGHSNATTSAAGFMSAADKTKLDGLGDSGVTESVAAVAQVSEINFSSVGPASNLFGNYIDIPFDKAPSPSLLRVWFDDDNAPGTTPATPSGGRIIRVGLTDTSTDTDMASAFVAAVNADADIDAALGWAAMLVLVTQPAGDLSSLINTTSAGISIVTDGADEYERFLAINGELITGIVDGSKLTGVDAEKLNGFTYTHFALAAHSHDFLTDLSNRPRAAVLAADFTRNATTFATVTGMSLPVVAGKTYAFEVEGFYAANTTTEGLGITMNGPSSTGIVVDSIIALAATGTLNLARATAWNTAHQGASSGGNVNHWFRIRGAFTAAANGNLEFQAKTETGTANSITIKSGALMSLLPTG